MTDAELIALQTLQNILAVFMKNNVKCDVTLQNDALVFDMEINDVPYRDELIAAGATFDIGINRWTYWSNEE